ncbi:MULTISPECIES: COG4315 family predicted lipoprotein [Stenotrophomonas]|uniref:Lipoprotein n=1 Tax=Stenotrophomonas lactitubi TaxID=2045214 RepID=A0AAW4GJ19_9GAMM|nr:MULTISPECIES: hypothetical protein [Stenotrophomonas]MBM9914544.1 hypothetical protein [Stenotrophomonas lactitubi]MBM9922835.1 hypothetical protein [Stenotrophomonas lactitubi]MBM9938673.1 hypothetical protein [Stenotrophomonas lactitubi]
MNKQRRNRTLTMLLLAGIVPVVCAAPAEPSNVHAQGDRLVDGKGMTLYIFDKDVKGSGESACDESCLKLWPAVVVDAASSMDPPYGSISTANGVRQLTHKGRPLYYFVKDKKPGDSQGDGVKDVWHVARPG